MIRAHTIYCLLLFALIAGAIEYQRRKRQFAEKLNVILEEKVSQRTEELRNKNYDIQMMNFEFNRHLLCDTIELKIKN